MNAFISRAMIEISATTLLLLFIFTIFLIDYSKGVLSVGFKVIKVYICNTLKNYNYMIQCHRYLWKDCVRVRVRLHERYNLKIY